MLKDCLNLLPSENIWSVLSSPTFSRATITFFVVLAVDRIVSLLSKKRTTKDQKTERFYAVWFSEKAQLKAFKKVKRLGVTKDIFKNMRKITLLVFFLLILKPTLIALRLLHLQLIDIVLTILLTVWIVYLYLDSVKTFKDRKAQGYATNTPLIVQRAYLDATLAEFGTSKLQISIVAVSAAAHSTILAAQFVTKSLF